MVAESSLISPDLDTHIRELMLRWTVPGIVVGVLGDGEHEIRAYGVTSHETGYPVRLYYDDFGMGDDTLARCVAKFSTLRQSTAPGELWAYCSSGFMLAGRVVELVTGKPFEAAMRERTFEPLGLDHSFFFAREAIVYPNAVGHSLKTPSSDEHQVCREYLLPRNVAPADGAIRFVRMDGRLYDRVADEAAA